jgi:hypothetical protein
VDAAIHGQAGEGAAGDLAADQIKARDGDRAGVSSTMTSTPAACSKALMLRHCGRRCALHLLIEQQHDRGGDLGDMLKDALDGIGDQLAGPLLAISSAPIDLAV